jgi:molybdopterin converting factor small subunit
MSCVTVEFFGIARARAGAQSAQVTADTLGELLRQLGERYPGLCGSCIQGAEFAPGYTANINGDQFTRDPGRKLRAGDSVLILSLDAGG